MDSHFGSILLNTTESNSRALMANAGNLSVTFVPLISLVATFVPRIMSRINTLRPTQSVTSRDFRTAKFHTEKSNDLHFCSNMTIFEVKLFPGFDDIFYNCKLLEKTKKNCKTNQEQYLKEELQIIQKFTIGKIIGINDCFYIQLYKCYRGFHFDSDKKKCIIRK